MQILNRFKKRMHKAWIIAKSRPLLRDIDMIIPRIIFKTKVRGRTVVYKPPGGQREIDSRRIISECTPREGKNYYFSMSKRYPHTAEMRRWEEYYDKPSLKDIFDGIENRRLKKLLKENSIDLKTLTSLCMKGHAEMEKILYEQLQRDGNEHAASDLRADQYMVDIKNGKPHFILIDS